jgi:hypothetical protein
MTIAPVGTGRAAWLVLGSTTLYLDNPPGGWVCTELDLGYPTVREVKDANPVRHGIIDRTQFFAERVITAKISAWAEGSARLDAIVEQFNPFLDPGARPVLHYTTDGNSVERTFTLRASNWSSPMTVPYPQTTGGGQRDFMLTWVAADPTALAAAVTVTAALSGASTGAGRTYNLNYSRSYPLAGGAQQNAIIVSNGAIPILPLLRIYGPAIGAAVSFTTVGPPVQNFLVPLIAGARIDAGHYLLVDTAAHTAFYDGDRAQNWLPNLDWTRLIWPRLPVAPDQTTMVMTASNATGATQTQATWQDRYLS